ncbi:nucleotide-binding [Trichoderma cornu-damae]|uniref:Nucleotide-binding n=1 Tax=Trichoderma cornu-damae TaxID=654480 RepID=A0A9P8QSK9_9HYPO|nr:nucleotide-binding [Trichoderma cornu-damae]
MEVRSIDRLVDLDLTPPSHQMVGPVRHEERDYKAASLGSTSQRVTSHALDRLDGCSDRLLITAPMRSQQHEANWPCKKKTHTTLGQHESPENHKKRAKCLEMFQEIQGMLRDQHARLQDILLARASWQPPFLKNSLTQKRLEHMLHELPRDGIAIVTLLLAVHTLGSSLEAVENILGGNITMISGLKSTSGLSLSDSSSSSAQQSPSPGMWDTHTDSAETRDDSSDLLLLDCVTPGTPGLEKNPPAQVGAPDDQAAKAWNVASPGADPFVDTPRRDGPSSEASAAQLGLKFHPDFTRLRGRTLLHVPSPAAGASARPQSRRVVLRNLPPDTTLAHIMRGIRYHGRLISINMLNTAPIFGNETKAVMLDFAHPKAAADFARGVRSSRLAYEAKNGDQYRADAWLIPSPSYAFSALDRECLCRGRSRSLSLKGFPEACIWYFVSAIGLNNVANRVDQLIWHGEFSDFYHYSLQDGKFRVAAGDSSQVEPNDDWPRRGPLKRLAEDELEVRWNRHPYNSYMPRHLRKSAALKGPTPLSPQERVALQHDIQESEVEDSLDGLENHRDTGFRILGSGITLTRRKWDWSMKAEGETKLLLANTLHKPDWAEQWDAYFEARGEINRRTWEQYGMLAKHRREKAAEQGLGPGAVPECGKDCEMGCRDIKAAPVAAAVKEYLDASRLRVVRTWAML